MSDQRFFEIEAAVDAVVHGAQQINSLVSPDTLIDQMSAKNRSELNDRLVALFSSLPSTLVQVTEDEPTPKALKSYEMRLGRSTKPGSPLPDKMRFFRVKPAWQTLAINVIALGIAVAIASPAGVVPALTIVKTCFDNLVTLERDGDQDSMLCYEAIVRWKMANVTSPSDATARQIAEQCAELPGNVDLDPARTLAALKRLEELGLLTVSKWGGSAGNLDEENNQWKTTI